MNAELSNGAGTIHTELALANTGSAGNSNATTLVWTGIMDTEYIGGNNLTIRFFDDYNTGGPFTSSLTNVEVTIHKMTSSHTFSTFSPGTLTSGTSGLSQSLNISGLTKSYLLYTIEADWVGTGGSPAFSNSINVELNNGAGTIHRELALANSGSAENSNATTLIWTGIMDAAYIGGNNLTIRFFDNYNSGGPFTSNLTNVVIKIHELNSPHTFSTFSSGTLTSGTSGVSTSMNVSGIPSDSYFVYKIEADWVGTGGSPAFSNSINVELNDGSGNIYRALALANSGSAENSNATTLIWTGIMDTEYIGGNNLTIRFFDNYNTGGPFTSSITDVNFTIYSNVDVAFPVELLHFQAGLTDEREVQLNWATASEINNDYFVVERSTDGNTFSEINRVNGKGSSVERSAYISTDPAPATGLNYYRLKQVDFDGTFEYSHIEVIRVDTPVDIICFPNPSSDIFNISIERQDANMDEIVTIYDSLGKAILTLSLNEHNQQIDLSRFPTGLYTAKFQESNEEIRLVKTP